MPSSAFTRGFQRHQAIREGLNDRYEDQEELLTSGFHSSDPAERRERAREVVALLLRARKSLIGKSRSCLDD